MNADSQQSSQDAFADQVGAGGRRRRRRTRQIGGSDVTELNMIPIMGLFTAMVLYLLKSYSSDPIQIHPSQDTSLPVSTSSLAPQAAVQVVISNNVVLVDDKLVARVNQGRVAAEHKRNNDPAQMFIEPLHEALIAKAENEKYIASFNKKRKELGFKGLLTIIADRRIPFRLLTEILYTAGKAEYGSYKFAVIKKES